MLALDGPGVGDDNRPRQVDALAEAGTGWLHLASRRRRAGPGPPRRCGRRRQTGESFGRAPSPHRAGSCRPRPQPAPGAANGQPGADRPIKGVGVDARQRATDRGFRRDGAFVCERITYAGQRGAYGCRDVGCPLREGKLRSHAKPARPPRSARARTPRHVAARAPHAVQVPEPAAQRVRPAHQTWPAVDHATGQEQLGT